ncbi:peptidylprolyl isomerase [Aliiruegeria sabulilitoris]|uniref:peptidylprolyl isomerase n=1 Tax=Aliiruegeria sabulilitoris TaxID=1510458 RepID=UPI0008307AA2|nr:peptidylprolyl isomerase [Aliiruegeria sabulilitoris]NDR54961.1 peptidylprolyl isomerase [Pseudoruegeria sp. M32A2M]
MIRDIFAGGAKLAALALAAGLSLTAGQGVAQSGNPFAPVVYVNDRAITNFEVSQRMTLLGLFRTPGDIRQVALDQLIDDRLRLDAAESVGIILPQEAINAGIAEFAERANMEPEQFIEALEGAGVAQETMRDFVKAGLGWRELVRGLYGQRAQITEAEVDRALAENGIGGAEVELAEIRLSAGTSQQRARAQRLALDLSQTIRGREQFAAAAERYSDAGSASNGGRTGRIVNVDTLSPELREEVLSMSVGGVSEPIDEGSTIAVYQLLGLRETEGKTPADRTIEYAEYLIPGGRSEAALKEAAKVAGKVDRCDDFYGINRKNAPERLMIHTKPVNEVPGDVAQELAKMDEGEVSTSLTRGGNLLMVMLCSRTPAVEDAANRTFVRRQLFSQRLAVYGNGYLAELKAGAIIRYP